MIRKLAKLGASSALAIALFNFTGCFAGGEDPGASNRPPQSTTPQIAPTEIAIADAWLRGDMPTIGHFDTDAYEVTHRATDFASSVTLHGAGPDGSGWAMIRLTTHLEGGFGGAAFTPGARLTSENRDLTATGCSGPSHGNWDFDRGGDVTVLVEAGPTAQTRIIHYAASYPGGQTTEGNFTVHLPSQTFDLHGLDLNSMRDRLEPNFAGDPGLPLDAR